MPANLKDQVVLVVGASSGIGRETAVLFSKEGARVMAAARREDRLKSLKEEHPSIEIAVADASDAAAMQRLAQDTQQRLGDIDVVIYVTGTNIKDRALTRLTPELWDMMVGTNLNGAFYITQAVLTSMRERKKGHLIFVSSISGLMPDVSGASYQASKRGLVGLAHAIRVEEREHGIRTCAICPGLVESELLQKRPVMPSSDILAKAMQPVDVAEAILAVAKMPARVAIPEMQILPTVL